MSRSRRPAVLAAFVLVLLVTSTAAVGVGLASAQTQNNTTTPTPTPTNTPIGNENGTTESVDEKAPYYDGANTEVQNESWMQGRDRATLENVLHLASRFGTFVVGGGESAQGGIGSAGPLLVGTVLLGAMIGASVRSGVGSVGGGVLSIAGIVGLQAIDVAPSWLYPVVLFGLGIVLSSVFKRAIR